MANVRAGVAYVDVRLGDVSKLKTELLAAFASMGREIGEKLGNEMKKNAPVESARQMGNQVGKVTAAEMSKAFFADSRQSFSAGIRALATGQVRTAGRLFQQAGAGLGLGLRTGIQGVIQGIPGFLQKTFNPIGNLMQSIGQRAGRAFGSIKNFVSEASASIDTFSKKIGFLAFQFQNLGVVASLAFTAPVAAILTFGTVIGVQTAAQIEQATAALDFLLPKGYDLEALMSRLQKVATESPIFDTADLVQFTQTFVAAGVEIGRTERFLKAFSNVALVTGTDTNRAALAIRAITQAFGKGKLQAEELTQQLAEAMPAAMKIIREQLGVTQKELVEMVKEGKISGNDLIDIFTKVGESKQFLEGAAAGANTLLGKWNELKESVQTQLGKIFLENADDIKKGIDEIGPLLAGLIQDSKPLFVDLINGFVTVVRKAQELVNWYKNLDPEQQNMIKKMVMIAVAIGPVVIALGTLGMAIGGIAAGIAAIANPVGAAIIAVIALGAALVVLWNKSDTLREKVKELWDGFYNNVVVPFKGPLLDSFNQVKDAWNKFISIFTSGTDDANGKVQFLIGVLKSAGITIGIVFSVIVGIVRGSVTAFGSAFAALASLIGGVIKIISGLIKFFSGLFTGDFGKMADGIKEIWNGLWDAIVGTVVNGGQATLKFIMGFVKGFVDFFKWMYNVIVGNSIVPDLVNAVIRWFTRLVNTGLNIFRSLGNFIRAFYASYIAPMVSRIQSGVTNVISTFTNLKNRVVSTIASLGSALFGAGRNIIQGLINGIKSMAGNVVSAAKGVVGDAVQGAKNLLGISSPSKVFMEIGKNTMEGFAIGIENNAKKPWEALPDISAMVPKFSGDYGDRGRPPFESRESGPALAIENYYSKDEDPYRQAEDWYFLIQSRGATA